MRFGGLRSGVSAFQRLCVLCGCVLVRFDCVLIAFWRFGVLGAFLVRFWCVFDCVLAFLRFGAF